MRFQSTTANCGPAALRNALLAHGIERSEQELEGLTGYTPEEGTSHKGIIKAVRAMEQPGLMGMPLSEARGDVALLRLLASLQAGHTVLLVVDNYEHWVCAFGLLGSGRSVTVHVADSAYTELVRHMTPAALLEWWRPPRRSHYYGIIV